MEERLHHELAEMADNHWWCVGRRRILRELVAEALKDGPAHPRIIDVGCGTGSMLEMLSEFGGVQGIDSSPHAVTHARERLGDAADVTVGDIPDDVPADGSVDLITAFDVIEHLDDDATAVKRFAQALRPGGAVVIAVPAYMFLWSAHDVVHHHKRRYTRKQLVSLLSGAGFTVERATYYNTILFPAAAVARPLERLRPPKGEGASDLRMPPPMVNRTLSRVFGSEARILSRLNLPVGVSVAAVART